MRVCDRCIISPYLQEVIRTEGKRAKCPNCGRRGHVVEADLLKEHFRPLSRYYHVAMNGEDYAVDSDTGEWMPGFAGGWLPELIQDEWDIFDGGVFDSDLVNAFLSEAFLDYDSSSNYAFETLFERHAHEQFQALADRLMHERRFFLEPEDFDTDSMEWILDRYLDLFEVDLESDIWYRGRKQARLIGDAVPPILRVSEMGAPSGELVLHGGRANPPGIAYLYLADSVDTVIAEVRAEPGDHVCVAEITLPKNLRIFNADPPHGWIDPFGIDDLRSRAQII